LGPPAKREPITPAPPVTFGLLTEIDFFSKALQNVAPFSSFRTAKMIPAVPAGQHAYCLPCRGQAAQQGIDLIEERTVAMRSSTQARAVDRAMHPRSRPLWVQAELLRSDLLI
jgi:hypothetical protein